MGSPKKSRLDSILLHQRYAATLKEAEALIRAGKVLIADCIADKPGVQYPEDVHVRIKEQSPFVSRGGVKLLGALQYFKIDPNDWTCADVGASSGGFTDCLLQHGARHVFAIDVAYGQLDWKLRSNPRVTVLERLNIRKVCSSHITLPLDFIVFDTSFISLKKVIPPVLPFFKSTVRILALIKPQFELAKHEVGKGGVVAEESLRLKAVEIIKSFGASENLETIGVFPSSIQGPKGNQEYLIYFRRDVPSCHVKF